MANIGAAYGIQLGQLRNDLDHKAYVENIRTVFQKMGIQIRSKNVRLKDSNSGKTVIAFITLNTSEMEQYAADQLCSPPPALSKLLYFLTTNHLQLQIEKCSAIISKSLGQFPSVHSAVVQGSTYMYNADVEIEIHDQEVAKYTLDQNLGTESRSTEYKLGGGQYLHKSFRSDLEKYACGFLNSQGGSLYIGVNDSGEVKGVMCAQKEEDNLRLLVDETMRRFTPPVLPEMYCLEFHPVANTFKQPIVESRIIELVVQKFPSDRLYETQFGDVFMRRDGSTEKLKPRDIQEWTRRHITNSGNHTDNELDRLRKSHEDLKIKYSVLLRKKKSCLCTIL